MNKDPDTWERESLLDADDALAPDARKALAQALTADPALAARMEANRRLLMAAATAMPAGLPSPAVRAHIRLAAQRQLGRRSWRLLAHPRWRHAVACAAVLTMAVSAWLMTTVPTPHANQPPAALVDMHALVSALLDQPPAAVALETTTPATGETATHTLESLARQLLAMEGLTLEEESDSSATGTWAPTADDSPSPTASQPRNTPAPRAKRYG